MNVRSAIRFFSVLLIFIASPEVKSQNVLLLSQEDVDAFDPNVSSITGRLLIEGEDIVDISNLSNIKSIGWLFQIYETSLVDLDHLSNLSEVGGNVLIAGNKHLEHLNGLKHLKTIRGRLGLSLNHKLSDLNGLNSVNNLGGLSLSRNNRLVDLSGLDNLYSVNGDLNIIANQSLVSIHALSSLECLAGELNIGENRKLENIDGLNNISSEIGGMHITTNERLSNIDALTNVSSVRKDVVIVDNGLQNLNGLCNLTSVGGKLGIGRNYKVDNLSGLSNLNYVKDRIRINGSNLLDQMSMISNLLYLSDVAFKVDGYKLEVDLLRVEGKREILTLNYYFDQQLINCPDTQCGSLDAIILLSPRKEYMQVKSIRQNKIFDLNNSEVNIYSGNGHLLSNQVISDEKVILPSNLNTGLYTLKIRTNNEVKVSKLFVVR